MKGSSFKEGNVTKRIEKQTAKVPSLLFLCLAGASMITSLGLAIKNGKKASKAEAKLNKMFPEKVEVFSKH